MPFYGGRGDFYRGVGDPGLFDFIKKAAGTALNFLTPAPIKMAVSAATGIIGHARGTAIAARESAAQRGLVTGLVHKQWAPGVGVMAPGQMIRPSMGGVPTGRRGEKQLFGPFVGGRRRHMNVANVKALRRAIRRLAGFEHLAAGVFALLRGVAPPKRKKSSRRHAHGAGCGCPMCRAPRQLGRGDFYQG